MDRATWEPSEDHHDLVVEAVRETLPEFAERNGVVLPEAIMDNLAHWVVSAMPRGYAKATCTGRLPHPDDGDWACACTGRCRRWVRVQDAERRDG